MLVIKLAEVINARKGRVIKDLEVRGEAVLAEVASDICFGTIYTREEMVASAIHVELLQEEHKAFSIKAL